MPRICLLSIFLLFALGLTAPVAFAQYDFLLGKEDVVDSSNALNRDSTQAVDSTQGEAADSVKAKPPLTTEVEESKAPSPQVLLAQAHMWMRRLVYRGKLDATHIGAYTRYQLTAWDEAVGSYGQVQARVGVYYLGPTEWLGKDAEWLQVVYETMESDPELIEYDLIIGVRAEGTQILRALYRVDRGDLQTLELGAGAEQVDFDAMDRPAEVGDETLDIYFGTFDTQKFRGSGAGGAEVVLYRNADVRPLGLVRMGYGDEALTLIDHGSDARPRFYVPPPPRGQ